jgi:KamA family protein
MIDNVGEEIPPVAADHSPARLIDQFYPRVATIKATNMCGMYCTHCLRIAHIGKKDRIYSKQAYQEALDYIRNNPGIRDVLVTGGDAFVLPNDLLRWLLQELDQIEHVRLKRMGSRIPVTTPQRIDSELLDILEQSNDQKPLRVVTQINTAQEITPVSRETFRQISKRVSAVLNQAVLLRGINDTRTKMWKLCETIQEAHVRPYYVFNCSYRNPSSPTCGCRCRWVRTSSSPCTAMCPEMPSPDTSPLPGERSLCTAAMLRAGPEATSC